MMADRAELDRALDEGGGSEMPDNVAPGLLGERPVDFRKVDTYQYSDNAGMVQENSGMVRMLFILILYLLVVTGPIAFWLLWREKGWTEPQKWVISAVLFAGYVAVALYLLR